MGHDLVANNKELEGLHMAGAWLHLLGQCGAYFPYLTQGARWYALFDERMTTHYHSDDDDQRVATYQEYPAIICNCGFEITEEEARVLARIARNYAAIQKTLSEPSEEEENQPITVPDYLRPFPRYIRRDWVELYERFAEWAEQSQGFKIY
jgi:hypothetical protein